MNTLKLAAMTIACAAILLAGAHADAATSVRDLTTDSLKAYSSYRTFGEFANALKGSGAATNDEIRAIEKVLKAHGLGFKTEIVKGTFTGARFSWGETHLSLMNNGDWKTNGGRILTSKPDMKIDQLFERAMSFLDAKNAQRTPLDLLIETADAQPLPQANASAAGGWSLSRWVVSHAKAGLFNMANLYAKQSFCGPDGAYMIHGWYSPSGTSSGTTWTPDVRVSATALKAYFAPRPIPKCNDVWSAYVGAIYWAPGATLKEKLQNSGEFDYGPDPRYNDPDGTKHLPKGAAK